MNPFLSNILNELALITRLGRRFEYKLSNFEGKYYINKIHKCNIPEAIYCGSFEDCKYYIDKIYGQECLFDFSVLQESSNDIFIEDFDME